MKKLLLSGFFATLSVTAIILCITHFSQNALAVGTSPHTCQANGTFVSPVTGAGAVTAADTASSVKALDWIKGQLLTSSDITTQSTIAPSSDYAPSHTGPVDGTFTLEGASYAVKNDAPLTITSPAIVASNYNGSVQGHVLTTPTAGRWIIQVYKKTDSGYTQVPKQALADAETGEFIVDLSDISSPPEGDWAFGILDAQNGYAPYGVQWPSADYYDGLEVQQKLVTDDIYDWATTRAYADGTFHFEGSNNGKKLLRLVDTASGDILAEYVKSTGLVRSYELDSTDPAAGTPFENRSYSYDQALALFAALSTNDEALATTLVDGLLTLQDTTGPRSGAFIFAASQLTPAYRDSLVRTGAHAIATDSLLAYIEKYPNAVRSESYTSSATAALSFLSSTLSTSGPTQDLYLGGYGDYSGPGGEFNATASIAWASTEHNIDTWHTFTRAARVLGNDSVDYDAKVAALQSKIIEKLYNATENRLNQGMTVDGPDAANPLDVNSWGAIQLNASGEYDKAAAALEQLPAFQFTRSGVTGYAPFYDSEGYPGAVPNVWFEGSFGVALALLRVDDTEGYRTLVDNLRAAQQSDGSFVYATDPDPAYEIVDRKAIASTAWYILATTGRDVIWNSCTYVVAPEEPPIDEPVVSNPTSPPTNTPSLPDSLEDGTLDPSQSGQSTSDITNDEIAISNPSIRPYVPIEDNVGSATKPITGSSEESTSEEQHKASLSWPLVAGLIAGGLVMIGIWLMIRRAKANDY